METYLEKFKALKTDKERWAFLISNPDCGLIVNLDNDDTFVTSENEDEYFVNFDDYLGWSGGVFDLLGVIGIKAQSV